MVSILLASMGITFIIFGIVVFIEKIRLIKLGIKTEGEIIDFEKSLKSYINDDKQIKYITVYKPVIKFEDEYGSVRIITYDNFKLDKSYRIGDKVKLIYSENDSENIEISEKQAVFTVICKLISIGIMFIVFSIILWLV